MRHAPVTLLLACALVAACSPSEPPSVPSAGDVALAKAPAAGTKDLVVYTQNVYVGADLDAVLASPPEALATNLLTALQTFIATNWPERAATIARFVDQQQPDVINLNEISNVTVQGLGDFGVPDFSVEFLPILQSALAARGLDYVLAGQAANIDATLPIGGPSIRLQDFDAMLVRRGISIGTVTTGNYLAHAPVTLAPGITIDLVRGYVIADISDGGRTARVVASHLEDKSPALHAAQGAQLIAMLQDSPYPVVIASDLNTGPTDPGAYSDLLAAGYQDAWLSHQGNPHDLGLTCCESAADLRNPVQDFTKRIDLVMVHTLGTRGNSTLRPVDFTLVGDQPSERTVTGMWPSDHAGVVATLNWKKLEK